MTSLVLPTFVKLASLGEGWTRTTAEVLVAADEARAFALLLVVSMCFSRSQTSTTSSAPMSGWVPTPQIREDSVEAA